MSDSNSGIPAPPPPPKRGPPKGKPQPIAGEKRAAALRHKIDNALSEEDWVKVYKEYAKTGDPIQLADLLDRPLTHVDHLIKFGVERLGLPPIQEHAPKHQEALQRVEALIGPTPDKSPMLTNLPDVQQAVTDRVVRETAAAQASLIASVKTADQFLGYLNKLADKISAGEAELAVPAQVTPKLLESLAKIAKDLAGATRTAVEQSRLVAGEPTQNIAIQVAAFAVQMNPEELRHYVRTKELPAHLRVRGGSRDTQAIEASSTVVARSDDD